MFHSTLNRLARSLAGLAMGLVVVSAIAGDFELSLPHDASDPVALAQPDGIVGEPSNLLQVFVGTPDACCDDKMPVAGRYAFEDNRLSFTPAFGFSPGVDYVARIRGAQGQERVPFKVVSNHTIEPATVTGIYPSSAVLPENVLRFYIHFSVPMRPGVAFNHIKLRDASGAADDAAFMRFKQELWDDDRTRLTVLLDPGRIKREVATNLELGPALVAGNQYTLSVNGDWSSADGQSKLAPFSKTFIVSAALRERPDMRLWKASSPCPGTHEPLELSFDRSFDRHLLEKDIQVTIGEGQGVSGAIDIGDGERSWRFTPHEAWPTDTIYVMANAKLEDIAANNFHDLLDHKKGKPAAEAWSTVLPIELKNCHSQKQTK